MQMTLAVERGTRQQALVYDPETGGTPVAATSIDIVACVALLAGSTASSIEADLDYGWHRRDCHEVSQRNGCRVAQPGTAAILRMVPPHSGQMAKSIAVNE